MRKFNRILSMLLAVLMIVGAIVAATTVQVFAADDVDDGADAGNGNEAETTPKEDVPPTVEAEEEIDYTKQIYATPEEKLATMKLAFENKELGYQLYVDSFSGEVACVNTITGEKLFTNPYDVGAASGSETTKEELLSQIIVDFTDNTGEQRHFSSFTEASKRKQIVVENIKNGIRVEYTIGREQTKTLVPRLISKERFDKYILSALKEEFGDDLYDMYTTNLDAMKAQKFLVYYVLYSKDPLDMTKEERNLFGAVTDNLVASDRDLARVLKDYPVVDNMPVYVFDPTASEAEIAVCEELILTYCQDYTYEELEYDHEMTEYESEDENPPVFRLALEYKIEADGLSVRLPANGIRFNESLYTLDGIQILPYMGAGHSGYEGYNFFPDGSGALFEFTLENHSIVGDVYGIDFAYHKIANIKYQKAIRYPVFGIVENGYYYTYTKTDAETGEVVDVVKIAGNLVDAVKEYKETGKSSVCRESAGTLNSKYGKYIFSSDYVEQRVDDKRGFVAIIEEGDALTSLTNYHAGALSDYNTIKMSVNPRPKDSYNLDGSISVGSKSDWTVVCPRKYVGTYKTKYVMLSDTKAEDLNKPAEIEYKTYDTSWFGMAVAYRDYLYSENVGVLTELEDNEIIDSNIPLYIETFGAVETTKKILSVPVEVMESLTTFDEVYKMYEYLSSDEVGIKNINFKLTGYYNGGMKYSVPGKLDFEKVVGGSDGFQELLDKAAEVNGKDGYNMGIFLDFDIVYQLDDDWFNGYDKFDHAAKTIDDRYATRREYSATQQKYVNYYEIVISPASFNVLYERIEDNYAKSYENVYGISVSTLGEWLHSDFDEDDPYNREDSKQYTIEAFQHLDKTYGEVMTSGGNAYVWKYVDHMIDVSLDSSRYNFSSEAVPFIGVVLHGSVKFAGEPLNMEGDMDYAILKAIENGASPYFILSWDNTQALKEYTDLSRYYSIRYDIWKEDIAEVYNTLNKVLCDVQDKYIVAHEFLTGERIPDADELEADILNEYLKDLEGERNAAQILAKEIALMASNARENGRIEEEKADKALLAMIADYEKQVGNVNNTVKLNNEYYNVTKKAYKNFYLAKVQGNAEAQSKYDVLQKVVVNFNKDPDEFDAAYEAMVTAMNKIQSEYDKCREDYINYTLTNGIKDVYSAEDADTIVEALIEEYNKYEGGTDNASIKSFVNGVIAKLVEEEKIGDINKDVFVEDFVDEIVDSILGAISKKLEEDAAAETETVETESVETESVETETVETETVETENEEADEEEFIEKLKSTIKSKIKTKVKDKENVKVVEGTIVENVVAQLSGIYKTATADEIKAIVLAEINAADGVKGEIGTTFATAYIDDFATKTFKSAFDKDGAKQVEALYTAYKNALIKYKDAKTESEIAKTAQAVAEAKAAIDNLDEVTKKYADAYIKLEAAKTTKDLVVKSGFQMEFDSTCETVYSAKKLTKYYSKFFDKFIAVIGKDNADATYADALAWYAEYVEADKALKAIEATATAYADAAPQRGNVDKYVAAIAKVNAMKEVKAELAIEDESFDKEISNAERAANQARENAKSSVVNVVNYDYKNIKKHYEETLDGLKIAEEAISILVKAENNKGINVSVVYENGKTGDVSAITNYDEIAKKSGIVKQAIDRALAIYNYLYSDRYEVIEEGRISEYTLHGHTLRYARNAQGQTYYFYGTKETGYSYYMRNPIEVDGEIQYVFEPYTMKGDYKSGVYEYRENGVDWYYRITEEGKFEYLEKDEYYGTFTPYAGLKYNESQQVKVLEDGTQIFYDTENDVYFSKNADGSYVRYTYSKSLYYYYNEAVLNENTNADKYKNDAFELLKDLDANFQVEVQNRIDRNNQVKVPEEVVEEEETSRYTTKNIVAVSYGDKNGVVYKTILLNYNNYSVTVVYDGILYVIPAYSFEIAEANQAND